MDFDAIKQHVDAVLQDSRIELYVIENKSRFTEYPIKPFLLKRLREHSNMKRVFCFQNNISKDAFATVVNLYIDLIRDSEYVLFSDGDTIPLSTGWLDEEIKIMEKYPDCGACRLQFDFDFIPETIPHSGSWKRRCGGQELEDCFEVHMGNYLTLFRGSTAASLVEYHRDNSLPMIDVSWHKYMKAHGMRFLATKQSRHKHYSWVRLEAMSHPSCLLKRSFLENQWAGKLEPYVWHTSRSCPFVEFEEGVEPITHQRPCFGGSVFSTEFGE